MKQVKLKELDFSTYVDLIELSEESEKEVLALNEHDRFDFINTSLSENVILSLKVPYKGKHTKSVFNSEIPIIEMSFQMNLFQAMKMYSWFGGDVGFRNNLKEKFNTENKTEVFHRIISLIPEDLKKELLSSENIKVVAHDKVVGGVTHKDLVDELKNRFNYQEGVETEGISFKKMFEEMIVKDSLLLKNVVLFEKVRKGNILYTIEGAIKNKFSMIDLLEDFYMNKEHLSSLGIAKVVFITECLSKSLSFNETEEVFDRCKALLEDYRENIQKKDIAYLYAVNGEFSMPVDMIAVAMKDFVEKAIPAPVDVGGSPEVFKM